MIVTRSGKRRNDYDWAGERSVKFDAGYNIPNTPYVICYVKGHDGLIYSICLYEEDLAKANEAMANLKAERSRHTGELT